MFDFFSNRTAKDYQQDVKDIYKMTPQKSDNKELYRVGFTKDGLTTLTLMSDVGHVTLSMNKDACEQLIRILRSTYIEEETNG